MGPERKSQVFQGFRIQRHQKCGRTIPGNLTPYCAPFPGSDMALITPSMRRTYEQGRGFPMNPLGPRTIPVSSPTGRALDGSRSIQAPAFLHVDVDFLPRRFRVEEPPIFLG